MNLRYLILDFPKLPVLSLDILIISSTLMTLKSASSSMITDALFFIYGIGGMKVIDFPFLDLQPCKSSTRLVIFYWITSTINFYC
jgi:hypothetical protein